MNSSFRKFRFTSSQGVTAGLVIDAERFANTKITDLSRFFPYHESRFMAKLEASPVYPTWEAAFNHAFNS